MFIYHLQTGLISGNLPLDTKVVSIWQNWCKPAKEKKCKPAKEKKSKPAKEKKKKVRSFVDCDHIHDSRAWRRNR